jgi:nitroreductase
MPHETPLPAGIPDAGLPVARALASRRSVRGFLPTPIPRETVAAILALAARAPSGTNVQPWKVYACTGRVRDALAAELVALHDAGGGGHEQEYAYYPRQWREPFLSRRRKLGWDYYRTVGITRERGAAGAVTVVATAASRARRAPPIECGYRGDNNNQIASVRSCP